MLLQLIRGKEADRAAVAALALSIAVSLGIGTALPAQQLRWHVPSLGPSTVEHEWMASFADYDGDGHRDFLRAVIPTVIDPPVLQIASGLSGATLWQLPFHPFGFTAAIACHPGDMDGDGAPDLAIVRGGFGVRTLEIYSMGGGVVLWTASGSSSSGYGDSLLGDLDVTGDGKPDVITTTFSNNASDVYVYGNSGALLYVVPCLAIGRDAVSLAKMGDMNGDGADDFLIGCLEPTGRGLQWLISGKGGSTIRETYGLLPGDHTSMHASNLGDIDGDGVNDYAAFPWYSAARLIAVAYSGATGAVIRSWGDYANSVVAGEDFDQDGVPDIVTGANWILTVNVSGRTYCWSGRDGSELWRVDAVPSATEVHPSNGYMWKSASLGVPPGGSYPALAWMDTAWWSTQVGAGGVGRIRAFDGARLGQGPVTGTACSSTGTLPLIGARSLPTGSRITIAKAPPGAFAGLWAAFQPLPQPVDVTPVGFAGCTLYVLPEVSWFRLLGTTGLDRGYAAVELPQVLSPTALGTTVHAQWIVLDPLTGDFGATRVHQLRLQ